MDNIAVIGATGLLGKHMMKCKGTVSCDVRFEESEKFSSWFKDHPDVDTIWYVARACRKSGVRRDFSTFMLEKKAMLNLMSSVANKCRIVYASTKVVYGLTDNDIAETSCDYVVKQFNQTANGTFNCPIDKLHSSLWLDGLGKEHKIYALTKLMCESYIKKYTNNFMILRIWDIQK